MKNSNTVVKWLAAFVALVVVLGCGGGGGGASTTGGGGGGTGTAPSAGQYLEFLKNGVKTDPLNAAVGDTLVAQFVNYDQFGTRTPLAVTNWSLTGSGSGSSVTVNGAGIVNILSAPPGYVNLAATAQVVGQPKTLNQDIRVAPATGTFVAGRVLGNNTSVGITGVQLEFVDVGGNVVGAALTDSTGRFSGQVGNGAVKLKMKPSSVPVAYFASLKYQSVDYAISGNACLLSVPTIVPGSTATFPSSIFIPRQVDGPPPPPTGCSN
ncbi:MAG: hypothetical protein ACKVQS_12745 [Fimbriimonadaceae bacterium]